MSAPTACIFVAAARGLVATALRFVERGAPAPRVATALRFVERGARAPRGLVGRWLATALRFVERGGACIFVAAARVLPRGSDTASAPLCRRAPAVR